MKEFSSQLLRVLLIAHLAISCSPTRATIDLSRIPPEEIVRRVKMNNNEVSTFYGTGTVSIESREFVGTGSISVSVKRPDSILIKIEGPFGMDIGSMLLTKERFTYYESYTNRVITGATTNRNVRSLLRVDLSFVEVMDFLAGTTSLSRETASPDSAVLDEDEVVLYFHKSSSISRYWIDPEDYVVVRYQLLENQEKPALETSYRRFIRWNNALLPRSISILVPNQRRGLTLHYDEIEINKPRIAFSLTIPENAKKIYW